MKFLKITTGHTSLELNDILTAQTPELVNQIEDLFHSFKYIEFENELGLQCMFAFGEEEILNDIFEVFHTLSINFVNKDITEDILKGNLPRLEDKHTDAMLRILIDDFLTENQTIDNILDKISESGIDSLNNYDKSILENK